MVAAGSQPSEARRAFTSASPRAWFTAALMRSTAALGVPVGASTPNQATVSKPGSDSASAGTSGRLAWRVAVVTASARTLPALICADQGGRLPIIRLTSSASTAATAGDAPL